MAIIDNAIYVDGVRTENPVTLSETFERMRERDGMGWIGLYRPSEEEIREVAEETGVQVILGQPLSRVHYKIADGSRKKVHYWAARVAPDSSAAVAATLGHSWAHSGQT